ncbi:MAG: PQQ-binding-like beta-propeller repeat protein [Polyangiaceae bacterium]|nr:PQQ-binding-like beta-propeller repeat protein [Polyangiaceae bacterium]
MLDVLIDGTNITARVGEGQLLPFLRDLAHATADLTSQRRARVAVPFYLRDDAWELGLLRDGRDVLLSVYRPAGPVEVAVFERRVEGAALRAGLRAALDDALARVESADARVDLACAREMLGQVGELEEAPALAPAQTIAIEGASGALAIRGDVTLRASCDARPSSARSELLPLLVPGQLELSIRGRSRPLGEGFVFLAVEALLALAAELLDAHETGRAVHRRVELLGARLVARVASDGAMGLTVRRRGDEPLAVGETFPGVSPRDLALAVAALARSLARAVLHHDRSQAGNLRLETFRAAQKALVARLRPQAGISTLVNDAPESYRAYAQATRPTSDRPAPPGKLRYAPRWSQAVPAIDLGGTFLCGDVLLAQGGRELFALDRSTGEARWSRPLGRAATVPTPGGLARLESSGALSVLDFGTGETTLSLKLAPRVGSAPAGCVVNAPGLPKLLVVTEGDRYVSAVDLVAGELRWRHTISRGGACRVRRAGRLLVLANGGPALTAVDVQSGEVVWKVASERRFSVAPTFDQDSVYALCGDPTAGRRDADALLGIDAWTGERRFASPVTGRLAGAAPLVTRGVVVVATRGERGLGLCAFDRRTGAPRWSAPAGLLSPEAALLVVDDAVFANTAEGELVAIDAESGDVRYRRRLCSEPADTAPRRLEPVLRSGALFVPQRGVHVVRPSDGADLGQVPCDLIPDLLRVDERCDVYVAEESGHVAALTAGPRLSLVR